MSEGSTSSPTHDDGRDARSTALARAAWLLTGDAQRASQWLAEAAKASPTVDGANTDALALRLIADRLGRRSRHDFDELDDTLRSDVSAALSIHSPAGQAAQSNAAAWALQQHCLAATVQCIPPASAACLLAVDLLGIPAPDVAVAFEVSEPALALRILRARNAVEDYLAPRCALLDRNNPCHCPGRVALAVAREFMDVPTDINALPHQAWREQPVRRTATELLRYVPAPSELLVSATALVRARG